MASIAKKLVSETIAMAANTTSAAISLENNMTAFVGLLTVSNRTADTYTCKLQYSADNVNWTDWISFTAASANGSEWVLPTVGTVPQYVRSVTTVAGVGTADIKIELAYEIRR